MQTEEFVNEVAQIANLDDRDQAAAISRATIETLCAYLPSEQARKMAAQLPGELTHAAEAGVEQSAEASATISQSEFFDRVANRADVSRDNVESAARAAITVLKKAVSRGETTDIVMDAPPELDALLSG